MMDNALVDSVHASRMRSSSIRTKFYMMRFGPVEVSSRYAAPFPIDRKAPDSHELSSASLNTASTPSANWERYLSGGGGKGAARRIARTTESSKGGSGELLLTFIELRVPSGLMPKGTVPVKSGLLPPTLPAFLIFSVTCWQ